MAQIHQILDSPDFGSSKQPKYKMILFEKLLSYLVYSQIWLNILLDDCQVAQSPHHKIELILKKKPCKFQHLNLTSYFHKSAF